MARGAGAFYRNARDSLYQTLGQTLGDLIPAPVSEAFTSCTPEVRGRWLMLA